MGDHLEERRALVLLQVPLARRALVEVDDDRRDMVDVEADRVGEQQELDDRRDHDSQQHPWVASEVAELLAHDGADPDQCLPHTATSVPAR